MSIALIGTKGHQPGEVIITFILGLFRQELLRKLVIASPQVSLACLLGLKEASEEPRFHLLRGSGFWILPGQEENDANLSRERKEINKSQHSIR